MKKKTLKIIFIFILILTVFGIGKTVQANSINQISMDIYVDNNGNAQVTETWICSANQGTEVYHPYYNLENSKITNLTVSEGTNTYTTLNSWNTSGSLDSKAYKCGINTISNGVELCWGISKYGSHTYTVKYNISNFVSELTDSQMMYWTLIPYEFSNSIGNVKIKIYTDSYIKDSIDVWGYGNYGGLAYVNNGAIYMDSDGSLSTSEYMTILVKFPLGTFNASNKLDHDFDYYYQMAEEGSTKYVSKNSTTTESNSSIFFVIFWSFLTIGMLFMLVILIIGDFAHSSSKNLQFGKEGKHIPKDVGYYRDIPCNSNLYRAYYIAYNYNIMKNKTDLLGAIILKWMKDGIIKTTKVETGLFKKKNDTAIVLANIDTEFEDDKEKELYDMLYSASGDGILEKKEFEKWCSGKYSKILNWFDNVLSREKKKLVTEGLIIKEEKVTLKIFKNQIYTATPELKEEAIRLAGLKRYLLEYTLIKEREAIEVTLFEDYLIYAQLMGIAKEVSKEFKDLYPEIIEQSHFNSYDDILFIHYCSASGISSANSARSAAQSYSSGGGGFSSGGGGGGSFGGGGGRRRLPLKLIIVYLGTARRAPKIQI